jgi:8-oxo-dGTP pyrophosphatase MutT (NUDIX family)
MHRSHILETLANYNSIYPKEKETVRRFEQFVKEMPACFERSHEPGHITGSAFILSPDKSAILLGLHAKMNRWFQLGGHADGCPHVDQVAFREAIEESGITKIRFYPNSTPIDLDIHEIPEYKNVKAHLHYDVGFLLFSEESDVICSNESFAIKWVRFDEMGLYCQEPSMLRAIEKIRVLLSA